MVESGATGYPHHGLLPNSGELVELLERACAIAPESSAIIRAEIPIEPVSALDWLRAQDDSVKTYWNDRDRSFEMAGIGAAHAISDTPESGHRPLFAEVRTNLSCAHPDLRYYGGISFGAGLSVEWAPFGLYSFVIPQFEILNKAGRSYFVCNIRRESPEQDHEKLDDIRAQLNSLSTPASLAPARLPDIVSRRDLPGRSDWIGLVSRTLDSIRAGDVAKVVLARETLFDLSGPIDPVALMTRLSVCANNAYLFCFQPTPGAAFLSLSPERLFKCVGGFVQSEALAGTRPRGGSEDSDFVLGQDLLHDDKELREHGFVIDSIRQAFDSVCKEVRADMGLSLVRLTDCQHLVCRLEGILDNSRTDADILQALHPTPAVGGYPSTQALDWISEIEPFDRGWYAGPVGWIGYDSSEFVLGIRSARVHGNALSVYSGAGIVAGSDPAREWDEIETKIHTFLSVLTHAD